MKVAAIQSAFNWGEFSPLMYGQVRFERYDNALALCENFVPLVQGGLTRRPGTYFVSEVKDSTKATRLVRFEFSTTQAYIIEFGDLYLRFYKDHGQIVTSGVAAWLTATAYVVGDLRTNGGTTYYCTTAHTSGVFATDLASGYWYAQTGTIYEIPTTYDDADLFELTFTQSADVLYITHPSYAPRKLSRLGHTTWTLTTINFLDGPYLGTNTTSTTITPSAISGNITLTASASLFASTDVGRLVRIAQTPPEWAASTAYAKDAVVRNNGLIYICTVAGTSAGAGSGPGGTGGAISDNTVVWAYASGGGKFWGYAKITGFTSATVVNATVQSGLGSTAATLDWRLGVWSGTTGYPACVTFYEDRLFFGGSVSNPTRIDGSKSGDYENFAPTNTAGVSAADNALAFTLNSNTVDLVRWMVGDEKGLLIGTAGSEWVLRPASTAEALSPTNVSARPSTAYGSSTAPALRVGKSVLFVQRSGRKVRDNAYVFEADGFRAPDITTFAEHITKGGLVEMAYQQEPIGTVWFVRGDGTLLSCLFNREQDAIGWGRHILGGSFGSGDAVVESVATIPEPNGTFDEVWLVVKRTIDGATVRYIEYLTKLFNTDDGDAVADAFFVDSGLTYSGGAVTSVSGLDHLEGETVKVLADGATHPDCVVASGAITLDRSATKVHAGLGYNSNGTTLRYDVGAADGTAQGKTQRINRVAFRFHETVGCKFGPDADNLDEITFREPTDLMDAAVPLFTGDKSIEFPGGYASGSQVYFRQEQPLPFTLLGLYPIMTTYDR